jgi:2-polyprenyl-3-methyl-5-hydroxy-6-metoxy-1,4-benzoquinol methylase
MRSNEGILVQDFPTCPLCQRDGYLLYADKRDLLFSAPGLWSLYRCTACELIWMNPRPLAEEMSGFYQNYYTHHVKDRKAWVSSVLEFMNVSLLKTSFGYADLKGSGRLEKATGRLFSLVMPLREIVFLRIRMLRGEKRGRLLDVGCGNGNYLSLMKKLGWEVFGIDPDERAVKEAQKVFGLAIHAGSLESARYPDAYFDAITLHHVIEHVPDPLDLLKECRRTLKPQGKIFVMTPNIDSLGHRTFAESWRGLEIAFHLHIFSIRALATCFERSGLSVDIARTSPYRAFWLWLSSHTLCRHETSSERTDRGPDVGAILQAAVFQIRQYLLARKKPVGEELLMVGTRAR